MSRIGLAFGCFFKLLFGGKLPARAADFLPAESLPKSLPEPSPTSAEVAPPIAAQKKAAPSADIKSTQNKKSVANHHRDGSLAILALFQREGRLIDFLLENVDDFEDAEIGSAVRDVHRGCRKVIDNYLVLEAIMPGQDDDTVTIKPGFDAGEIKLVGNVSGVPPFTGVLRHHGWRASETNLPKLTGDVDRRVLAAAQIEVR